MTTLPLSAALLPPPAAVRAPESGLRPLLEVCGLGWFCLRAEGRREHVAAANLAVRTQVEAFAPRIRVRRERRAGGVDTRTEALFPGYVFARFDYPGQLRHVVSTTGVLGLVAFGGPPPRLTETTISHLRRQQGPAEPAQLAPVFEEGEWVRVAGGCFRGSEGRVRLADAAQGRVRVLLSLLGHDVEISLPGDQLIARPARPAPLPAGSGPAAA